MERSHLIINAAPWKLALPIQLVQLGRQDISVRLDSSRLPPPLTIKDLEGLLQPGLAYDLQLEDDDPMAPIAVIKTKLTDLSTDSGEGVGLRFIALNGGQDLEDLIVFRQERSANLL